MELEVLLIPALYNLTKLGQLLDTWNVRGINDTMKSGGGHLKNRIV